MTSVVFLCFKYRGGSYAQAGVWPRAWGAHAGSVLALGTAQRAELAPWAHGAGGLCGVSPPPCRQTSAKRDTLTRPHAVPREGKEAGRTPATASRSCLLLTGPPTGKGKGGQDVKR